MTDHEPTLRVTSVQDRQYDAFTRMVPPGIEIDVTWEPSIPTQRVLDQFDALAASVRTQIEAHQEKP